MYNYSIFKNLYSDSDFLNSVFSFLNSRYSVKLADQKYSWNSKKIIFNSEASHVSRVKELEDIIKNDLIKKFLVDYINFLYDTEYTEKDICFNISNSGTECSIKIGAIPWNILKIAVKPECTYTYNREIVVIYFLIALIKRTIDSDSIDFSNRELLTKIISSSINSNLLFNGYKNERENEVDDMVDYLYNNRKVNDYLLCAKEIYNHIKNRDNYIIHYNTSLVKKIRNKASHLTNLNSDKWCPADLYLFDKNNINKIFSLLNENDIDSFNKKLLKYSIPVSLKERKCLHGSLSLNVGFKYLLNREDYERYIDSLKEYNLHDKKKLLVQVFNKIQKTFIKDKIFIKIDNKEEISFKEFLQRKDYNTLIDNFLLNERGIEVYNTFKLLDSNIENNIKKFYKISSSITPYSLKHLKVDYCKEKLKSIRPNDKSNIDIEKIIIPFNSKFISTRIYAKVNKKDCFWQIRSKHNDGVLYFNVVQ